MFAQPALDPKVLTDLHRKLEGELFNLPLTPNTVVLRHEQGLLFRVLQTVRRHFHEAGATVPGEESDT